MENQGGSSTAERGVGRTVSVPRKRKNNGITLLRWINVSDHSLEVEKCLRSLSRAGIMSQITLLRWNNVSDHSVEVEKCLSE